MHNLLNLIPKIYIVDILGQSKPRLLSSGIKGATADPIFSKQGDKIAWTEMEEDGYESDRYTILCCSVAGIL